MSEELTRKTILERFDLVDPSFLRAMAKIMGLGAQIHGEEAYLSGKNRADRSPINHALDHMNHYQLGHKYDKLEIGDDPKWHLAAAACNLLMEFAILEIWEGPAKDEDYMTPDEPFKGPVDGLIKGEPILLPPENNQEAQERTEQILNTQLEPQPEPLIKNWLSDILKWRKT